MTDAELFCLRCGYEWADKPGPHQCPKCGHDYVKWLNYEETKR